MSSSLSSDSAAASSVRSSVEVFCRTNSLGWMKATCAQLSLYNLLQHQHRKENEWCLKKSSFLTRKFLVLKLEAIFCYEERSNNKKADKACFTQNYLFTCSTGVENPQLFAKSCGLSSWLPAPLLWLCQCPSSADRQMLSLDVLFSVVNG